MTEDEFVKTLVELQTEEVHWKNKIFYPKLLPSDRDEINNIVRKWEKLEDVVCLWDFKIRRTLNMIGEVKWGESEFNLAKTIDLKALQMAFLIRSKQGDNRRGENISQVIVRWNVSKISKLRFFKKTPIFNVELWIACDRLDTDEELFVTFRPTNTERSVKLVDVETLRESLIDMYKFGPEYTNILEELFGLYRKDQIDFSY